MYSIVGLSNNLKEETTLQHGDEISRSFLETNTYKISTSKDQPLLYLRGNKGTGKSAILTKIYNDNQRNTIIVYFKDFFNEIEKRTKRRLARSKEQQIFLAYEREWEIELWIQIIMHLYGVHRKERFIPFDMGDYLKLYEFLEKYGLPLDLPLTSEVAANVSSLKISIKGFEVEFGSAKKKAAGSFQHDLNKAKKHAINILGKTPLFLLVDEFDKIDFWDDSVRLSIRGLIEAIFSLVRDVNKEHRDGNKLLIRVAIRGDMFDAAKLRYVDSQKLPIKGVDLTWSRDNLEELIAKKIRAHWDLSPEQIHRKKIMAEILPMNIGKEKDAFGFLCTLARSNPRALFMLFNECTQSAVDRKETFLPDEGHPPLCIAITDIQNTIETFADAQLQFVIDANGFLYQGLESVVDFLGDQLWPKSTSGNIRFSTLNTSLTKYLNREKELAKTIKSWPTTSRSVTEKVIRIYYDVGLLGTKRGVKIDFAPTRYTKTSYLAVHPTYHPVLLHYRQTKIKTNPDKEINDAKLEFFSAIEHLGLLIEPQKRKHIGDSQVVNPYRDKDIVHGIVRVIWSIRYLLKKLIAYGDQAKQSDNVEPISLINVLEKSLLELGELFRANIKSMHLIAILYNPNSYNGWQDKTKFHHKERFEIEMELPEHKNLFLENSQKIYVWVDKLLNDQQGNLSKQLDTILVKLRDDINSPLAEGYIIK